MKLYLQTITFLLIATMSQAQTQTLFGGNKTYGGFGGPIMEFSNINGTLVTDVGGGGALIVNDFFFGGYGLGNDNSNIELDNGLNALDFGHGGFWLGYTHNQHKLVHLYSSFRIGWGDVDLKRGDDLTASDNLMAICPELGLEFNVTRWFKLGVSGGYRIVTGLDNLPGGLDNDDFTGGFGMLTFRFGGFGDYNDWDDDDDDDYGFNF